MDAVSAPILTLASISLLPHVKRRCCSIFPEAAFRIGIDTSAVVGPLGESLTVGAQPPCDLKSSGVTARMPPSAPEYQ